MESVISLSRVFIASLADYAYEFPLGCWLV